MYVKGYGYAENTGTTTHTTNYLFDVYTAICLHRVLETATTAAKEIAG